MSKVLCFGEALIDFLNTGQKQEERLSLNTFTQYPGGAPANAAVAVAKLGGQAAFVGQVGTDMFGDFLVKSLAEYGVDTQHVLQHKTLKTALAFVARDEAGERKFSFYRDNSADLAYMAEQADCQMFKDAAVFHFCSNTLTEDMITDTTAMLIAQARQAGALISFDVNLRHNLWSQGHADKARVNDFVGMADVLKFSREEIEYLTDDIGRYVKALLNDRAQLVVITNDGGDIRYFTRQHQAEVSAPVVEVVDTTAGGDSFSGGLLYQLSLIENASKLWNDPQMLAAFIGFAAQCGGFAVTRPGAFPALPTISDVAQHIPAFINAN